MNENKMNNFSPIQGMWAILPEAIQKMEYEYLVYHNGTPDYRAHIEAQGPFEVDVTKAPPTFFVVGDIGILQIDGVIMPRADFFSAIFGGVAALDVLTRDFKILLASDDIAAIILHIDSPGGNIAGMFAFADMIFEARNTKPVFTFSDSMMVSAAMLIGSAAGKDNVVISDEGVITGGLASLTHHIDFSSFQEKIGIRETVVSLGKNKIITDTNNPLSEEGRASMEAQLQHIDNAQMEAVARFRETTVDAVIKTSDKGKIFVGSQAIPGLIDGMMGPDEFTNAVKAEVMSANFRKN